TCALPIFGRIFIVKIRVRNEHAKIPHSPCGFVFLHALSLCQAPTRARGFSGHCGAQRSRPALGGFAGFSTAATRKGSPGSAFCLREGTRFSADELPASVACASLRLRFPRRELVRHLRVSRAGGKFAGSWRAALYAGRVSR